MTKERNYGVDMLRLVLMFMVCILHILGKGGVLTSCDADSLKYRLFWLLETASYCAVDAFAIISGYMASDKPRKYEKLADMWFQAFFYSFVLTFILTAAGINGIWEKEDVIRCALPVINGKFWYFTAYFALFFAMPVLNRFVFSLDEATAEKALIIIFVLFSLMEIGADPFELNGGYSAMWLAVLYCAGAFAKRAKLFETKKTGTLIILWLCCTVFTWAVNVLFGNREYTSYVSPTVLLSGILAVIIFSRLKIKGTVVSRLSPLALGIYFFQSNQVIWNGVMNNAFAFIAEKALPMGLLLVFAFAALIFASGLLAEFARSKIAAWLRVPALSKSIVKAADRLLGKVASLLR